VKDAFVIDGFKYGQAYQIAFTEAIVATGRPMFIESVAGYWFLRGAIAEHANSWRFCEDHEDEPESTGEGALCRVDQGERPFNLTRGEAGAWPYMDFLHTGGEGCAPYEEGVAGMHCPGQTDDQYRTEFAVWTLAQSPLIVDTDVRNLTAIMAELLLNAEILEPHQSTATPPGRLVARGGASGTDDLCRGCEVWARSVVLGSGAASVASTVVALVNWKADAGSQTLTVRWPDLGFPEDASVAVRDLFRHVDLPNEPGPTIAFAVPPGGTVYLKLTPLAV
jgi:hypothetical protein